MRLPGGRRGSLGGPCEDRAMPVCAQCGREAAEDAQFCAGCGALLAPVEPAREERKVVTLLFADLVGSTARAEGLDPEDVRAVLAPFYARLRSELGRFGGTVEKFIGDAVMAVFGAPVAHEDDPERGVRAALAIRDWALEEEVVQVRAVHTGEALVSLGARPRCSRRAGGTAATSPAPASISIGRRNWSTTRGSRPRRRGSSRSCRAT